MKIGIDIMGGDYAPDAALRGIKELNGQLPDHVKLVLIGDEKIGKEHLDGFPNAEFFNTSQVITMGESPTKAFAQKLDSSIFKGFELLKAGELDVFLSAGNTGAMLVGSLYSIKAIEGVTRPTITTLLPKEKGGNGILLDVGANPDCKPETLMQFAVLGSLYAKHVYKIENPRVALLNIGSEKEKGNIVAQTAYGILEGNSKINFVGNIEGYDLFSEKADVVVCDGFTGNIVLKAAEGIYEIMKKRKLVDDYFTQFDYENYGGTPILGVNKPVVIGHGVSSPVAFKNMILLAKEIVESGLSEKIKLAFKQ